MNLVSLVVSIGLLVMWIINLAVGGGHTWFTWLVFVSACLLFINSVAAMGGTKHITPTRAA